MKGKTIEILDMSEIPEGWTGDPENGPATWIEHHKQGDETITVALSVLSKGLVDEGYNLISKAYHIRPNRRLTVAGYDAFAKGKWVGRFRTEALASKAADEAAEHVEG